MNTGWIKLHRKFCKWGWYQKSEMVHLFLHFLLLANHEENEWQGIKVKKGQFITGLKKINQQTKIPVQTIRTCISRLKSTGEITSKSTNKFRIITVIHWDKYQTADKVSTSKTTSKLTNNQQTTNKQLTPNKNDKNYKNVKNIVRKIKFSAKDIGMVDLLTSLVQQNNPDWQMRGNRDNWAEHIEKIHRIDGRTYEQIETMIRWVQADSFWSQNILSTSKLREKFNDLIPRLRSRHKKKTIIGLDNLVKK